MWRVFLVALALLIANPAWAVIGTPIALVVQGQTVSGDHATITGTTCAAGSAVFVAVGAWNAFNGTVTSITDSAGNSYTIIQDTAQAGNPYPTAIGYSLNIANALPNGGWVQGTNSGAVAETIGAWCVSGANGGADTQVSANSGGSGVLTISLSTGALATSSEIVFGLVSTTNNINTGFAEPTGFTELMLTGSSGAAAFGYNIVSSTASVTYNPSWTNNATVTAALASFKATSSSAVIGKSTSMSLMGVGQ